MSYTIGDGIASVAVVAGIVSYVYIKKANHLKRMEMIHQERMAAMEKGIPLPEFPMDEPRPNSPYDRLVIPILGLVLSSLSLGAMVMLYIALPKETHSMWVSPLPFTFLGVGFIAFHLLKVDSRR